MERSRENDLRAVLSDNGSDETANSASKSPAPSSQSLSADEATIVMDNVVVVESEEDQEEKERTEQERALADQSARLPFHRVLLIYSGIGFGLFLSFVDQTGVSTAAPAIGSELGASDSITWLGTSFLVSNCAMHLVYGRLSDIFGRKTMFQVALTFLGFGNLLCGFAKTPVQLYVFRAISGLGGGGVNGIAITIVSDIVSLKDRGTYQGLISAFCTTGSAVGPFLGGGLASAGQWRWLFWLTTIISACVVVSSHFILPLKPVTGSMKDKIKQIDYLGIFLSSGGIILLLVAISSGGSSFAWNSSVVIALIVVGSLLLAAFVVVEWRSPLPILPLRLFKIPTVSIVQGQQFLVGAIYYGNIFYVPMFFQYIMGYSSLKTGAMVLVYTFPQAFWGIGSGLFISKTNHYKIVIIIGSLLWTVGAGLQCLWKPGTSLGEVLGVLQVGSVAVGFCLQTTLIAMYAVTASNDRAVVTSSRNFFRTMGGSFGLAISNAIFNNVVRSSLPNSLSETLKNAMLQDAITTIGTLTPDVKAEVLIAYTAGIRMCFIFFTAASGLCFLLSFPIKEVIFKKDPASLKKETKEEVEAAEGQVSLAEMGQAAAQDKRAGDDEKTRSTKSQ